MRNCEWVITFPKNTPAVGKMKAKGEESLEFGDRESAIRNLMNLWGGRFTGETDKHFAAFNASFSFDRRLIFADLRACAVHSRALGRAGVLQQSEAEPLTDGLKKIRAMPAAPRSLDRPDY